MEFNSLGMFRGWAGRYSCSSNSSCNSSCNSPAEEKADSAEELADGTSSNQTTAEVRGQVGIWADLIDVPLPTPLQATIAREAGKPPLPALVLPRDAVLVEVAATDVDSLKRIGQLRYAVWEQENSINSDLFPDQCWVDGLDKEVLNNFCHKIRAMYILLHFYFGMHQSTLVYVLLLPYTVY